MPPFACGADERPDYLRRQQTHLVGERLKSARPVLLTAAGLNADQARRAIGEVLQQFPAVSRRSMSSPVSMSTQYNWNTRFAISTPTTVHLLLLRRLRATPRRSPCIVQTGNRCYKG